MTLMTTYELTSSVVGPATSRILDTALSHRLASFEAASNSEGQFTVAGAPSARASSNAWAASSRRRIASLTASSSSIGKCKICWEVAKILTFLPNTFANVERTTIRPPPSPPPWPPPPSPPPPQADTPVPEYASTLTFTFLLFLPNPSLNLSHNPLRLGGGTAAA